MRAGCEDWWLFRYGHRLGYPLQTIEGISGLDRRDYDYRYLNLMKSDEL